MLRFLKLWIPRTWTRDTLEGPMDVCWWGLEVVRAPRILVWLNRKIGNHGLPKIDWAKMKLRLEPWKPPNG